MTKAQEENIFKRAAWGLIVFLIGVCGYFLREQLAEVKEQARTQQRSNKMLYESVITQRHLIQQVQRNSDDIRDLQRRGN